MESYVSAMMLQMEDMSEDCRSHIVDTIYFGGGTPSLLPISQLQRLMGSINRNFKVSKAAEITIEVNPGTVNAKYLKALRKLGFNRLSIGLQSASHAELKALGRIHTPEKFGETYSSARESGFDNISVDIMYGLPGQTVSGFKKTLGFVLDAEPDHISLYCLKIEEGTPFHRMRDSLTLPGEDAEFEMYKIASETLAAEGYERYEMSNFARNGKYSKHNLKYWNCEEYVGIGASAHSYFADERYSMIRNAETYINGLEIVEAGIRVVEDSRIINKEESMNEYVMLRMRLGEGVDVRKFKERYEVDFNERFGQYLDEYIPGGFVEKTANNYYFTTKGMFVSNFILSSVLDFSPDTLGSV